MKAIRIIVPIAAAVLLAVSCNLNEFSHDKYTAPIVFGTEGGLEQALNGLYKELPKVTTTYTSEPGDVDYLQAELGNGSRFNFGYGKDNVGVWTQWDDIREINLFLDKVQDPDICTVDEAIKANYIGIARFLRSIKYVALLLDYGDVPYFDHVTSGNDMDDMYKERDSRDDVIKYIIEDLDYGAEHITNESPDRSTPDKWCCKFLKARICLFEASYRKYHNLTKSLSGKPFTNYTVESLYQIAAKEVEDLMASGRYKLNTNAGQKGAYRELFYNDALNKDEVLMGAVTAPGVLNASQNQYFNRSTANKSFTRAFIHTYLMSDGTPFTDQDGYASKSFVEEFQNRDGRLTQTVRGPQYKIDGKIAAPNLVNAAPLGYQIIKFTLDKELSIGEEQGRLNTNSTPYFRYAEALLIYAEAKAELGQMTNEIWSKTVGALRARAGITGATVNSVPTKVDPYLQRVFYPGVTDPILLEIRRDRAIELCLEGQRIYDWRRWAIGERTSDLPWTGFHIENINTLIDINGDGVNDYYFSEKVPSGSEEQRLHVPVFLSGKQEGLHAIPSPAGGYDLEYFVAEGKRYWYPDGRQYLTPIAESEINKYATYGYTLTQNPYY